MQYLPPTFLSGAPLLDQTCLCSQPLLIRAHEMHAAATPIACSSSMRKPSSSRRKVRNRSSTSRCVATFLLSWVLLLLQPICTRSAADSSSASGRLGGLLAPRARRFRLHPASTQPADATPESPALTKKHIRREAWGQRSNRMPISCRATSFAASKDQEQQRSSRQQGDGGLHMRRPEWSVRHCTGVERRKVWRFW